MHSGYMGYAYMYTNFLMSPPQVYFLMPELLLYYHTLYSCLESVAPLETIKNTFPYNVPNLKN